MGYWNSRGLRGSVLEDKVNFANDMYRKRGLAVFQKIPTPITPVKVDNKEHTITLAYFEQQSTVDYIGIVQGIAVCFDAKETAQKSLPVQNIHEHQIQFMKDFQRQGGLSFLLVEFTAMGECYLLPLAVLTQFWNGALQGGRKSIPYTAFEKRFQIRTEGGTLHYLTAVGEYLSFLEETKAVME